MIGRSRRGATTVEMTLVGIPMIFVLISIFEISRGMWMYHTLSYAVKDGVRFAIVHGINCVTITDPVTGNTTNPNNCPTTIAQVAGIIQKAAVGVDPGSTELVFTLNDGTSTKCYMGSSSSNAASGPYGGLVGCLSLTTTWPPDDGNGTYNGVGKLIRIDIKTPFHSALAMFWPGSKPVGFAAADFGASSLDSIQF